MRKGQVTNFKFPAFKHLICLTFQPLGLNGTLISCQEIYKLSVYAGIIQKSNSIRSYKLMNKTLFDNCVDLSVSRFDI